ncbi:MAG: arylsulfatase, partial [Planctomycetota bacterium]
GYGDLACHGNPVIETPQLDRLYAQSTRLANFHVDPLCSPTRAALMTGRYSMRAGVWATTIGRSLLDRRETTVADVFKASGYRTGMFGKWHLGDNYPYRPQDRGFDTVLCHGGGGVGQAPDFWGNDYFDDTYFRNGEPEKCEGYCTDVFFDAAIRFIEASRERPFFVYLATNAPHGPYRVDKKYSEPYHKRGVKSPTAEFYGMITNFDENMGRLMARLDELKLADDTLLVYLTDNGTAAGAFGAGMRGRKGSPFEGGHRVPCFLRWPGRLHAGRDVSRLAAHIDLLPTFIELCGLKRPEGVAFDGISLATTLTAEGKWRDRTLFVQTQQCFTPRKWRGSAVMTQDWRLVNGQALFHLTSDPGQRKNVAARHPEVVARLRKAYEGWWAELSERFDQVCPIVIGSDRENPASLTAFDWLGFETPRGIPWSQGHVRNPKLFANGAWAVEVERDGDYEITLRRFPWEAMAAMEATRARLKVGEVDEAKAIRPTFSEATFKVRLKAGRTQLQAWLTDMATGKTRGANYVIVKRL